MNNLKYQPQDIKKMISIVKPLDNKKNMIKINNNTVKLFSFQFKEEYKNLDDSNAFDFVKEFIEQAFKNYNDYMYHINFEYNDFLNYNINNGFVQLEDLNLFSFFDEYKNKNNKIPNIVTGFDIFYTKKPELEGGNDTDKTKKINWNNCLYNALKDNIQNFNFKYPSTFKKFLGIEPKAKVPVSLLPKIEDKFKINITLRGDYEYSGCSKYNKTLNLKLVKGHYFIAHLEKAKVFKRIKESKEELPLFIFCKITNEHYPNIEIPEKHHRIYIYTNQELDIYEQLKNKYNLVIVDYDIIKQELPQYNPLLFYTLSSLSYKIFYDHFKNFDIQSLDILEEQWLKKSSLGGLRYADVTEKIYKKAYNYDINRFYPFLQTQKINIPLNKPEFKILDELPKDYLKPGIYRAKVQEDMKNILFSYNPFNLYSHISLKHAEYLGLSFELIQDGEFNSMIYSDKYANTQRLNKVYLKLYEISKKCKTAKLLMNSIWGKICQRNKKFEYLRFDTDKEKTMNYSDNILRKSFGYELEKYGDSYFKYPYARLMPFLLSKGRFHLAKVLKPYQKDLLYIHTDGWISKKKLNIKIDSERKMGDIRLDSILLNCKILNKNIYIFE